MAAQERGASGRPGSLLNEFHLQTTEEKKHANGKQCFDALAKEICVYLRFFLAASGVCNCFGKNTLAYIQLYVQHKSEVDFSVIFIKYSSDDTQNK